MKENNESNSEQKVSIWYILWEDWIKSILIAIGLALIIRIFIFAPTVVIGPSMETTLQDPNNTTNEEISARGGSSDRLIAERLTLFTGRKFKQGEIITFSDPSSKYYTAESFSEKVKTYLFERKDFIKRIIATEGDTVKFYGEKMLLNGLEVSDYSISDNQLYIDGVLVKGDATFSIQNAYVCVNGEKLDEPYINQEWDVYVKVVDGQLDSTGTSSDVNIDITVPEGCVYVMGDNREVSYDSRKFTSNTTNTERKTYASIDGCIKVSEITGRVLFRFWPLNRFGAIDK